MPTPMPALLLGRLPRRRLWTFTPYCTPLEPGDTHGSQNFHQDLACLTVLADAVPASIAKFAKAPFQEPGLRDPAIQNWNERVVR